MEKITGEIEGKTITVETRYPNEVHACIRQGIPLNKVFAKIEDTDGDGILNCSYPLVKAVNGVIPVEDGEVVFYAPRVILAGNLAKIHHESEDVVSTINAAKSSLGFEF